MAALRLALGEAPANLDYIANDTLAERADDIAVEVVGEFCRDEILHRMRALGVAVDRDGRQPLCRVRPLEGV
jgi:hypothetical protein